MAFLQRIVIDNFRNLSHREINLSNAKNVIVGKNMSGKTNTLNAIHWAFTGKTLDGNDDNRANFPIEEKGVEVPTISVNLNFGDFTFERRCECLMGVPTVSVYIDGDKAPSVKNGVARLHAKLGLSDFVLKQTNGFDIVSFLLNPLYFDTVSPSALRKLFYKLLNFNFKEYSKSQGKTIIKTIEKYALYEPYALCDEIATKKKIVAKDIATCKGARALFPSIEEESTAKEKELSKKLVELETDEALIDKYALCVSSCINDHYKNLMGIKVCLLEKGVGDDVYKDVCYPILPKSDLPFKFGSYAEKSYIGMRFIQEVCLKFNIKPLPILLDNMESLDKNTESFVDQLGVQYIGAKVE